METTSISSSSSSSSSLSPAAVVDSPVTLRRMAAVGSDEVKVRRRTVEAVLEQCQRALEMLREADLSADPESAAQAASSLSMATAAAAAMAGVEVGEAEEEGDGDVATPRLPTDADYEADELCDLLKSRVESPDFLEKLDSIQKSVYQNSPDETTSWAIVNTTDAWEDKNNDGDGESDDGYVIVGQEDIVDGIACFMAAYLVSLKQTKELTPSQLQRALSKTFSTKKKKSKLQKAWDGTTVLYNVASWSATAVGIYQNPAIVEAAATAFWTSCRAISKLL